jgi:alpha-1,6-mannosyltransferase
VRGAGLAFAALAALGPVFYPWYVLPALALLAVSCQDERARRRLAVVATALAFLILPNGAGIAAQTKLPGALLVTAALLAAAWRLVRNREPERAF